MTQPAAKRTRQINLLGMRKAFALKPMIVGMSAVFLAACGEERLDSVIYSSVDDCIDDNPGADSQCRAAYEDALQEAARTAPRFNSEYDCEHEFGPNQCQYVGSSNVFIPFMAGYLVSDLLSPRKRYYTQPLYTSYSRYSPYRNRWFMADGYAFDGDIRKRRYKVRQSSFKPKPSVTRTIKRGGFGSSVRAKSKWGGRSSSRGWGG